MKFLLAGLIVLGLVVVGTRQAASPLSPPARNEICLISHTAHNVTMTVRGPDAVRACTSWARALGNGLHEAGAIQSSDMTGAVWHPVPGRLVCEYVIGVLDYSVNDTGGAYYGDQFCEWLAANGGK